jgi:hypothetical protein
LSQAPGTRIFLGQKIENRFLESDFFLGKFPETFWRNSASARAGSLNADPETFPVGRWSLIAVPFVRQP